MENQVLTDEQKEKIRKLERSSMFRGIWFGIKNFILLVIATFFVIVVNYKYVHSNHFLLLSGLFNGFLLMRLYYLDFLNEYDRVKEELNKILNPGE